MNRRNFLGAILAAGVAPAIVRASSLMPGRGVIATIDAPYLIAWGPSSSEAYGLAPGLAWLEECRRLVQAQMLINPPLVEDAFGVLRPLILPAEPWFTLELKK